LQLFDIFGKQVEILPLNFHKIGSIEWKKQELPFKLEAILDVDNPLIGQDGAARIFGKQKGSTSGEIEVIELGFNKLLKLLQNKGLIDSVKNLSGAGGGIPAGLQIFFGCDIKKAESFIKEDLGIQRITENIDAIITGEGSFDKQSLAGKGAGIILNIFKDKKIPLFLCCGRIDGSIQFGRNVHPIELEKYFGNKTEAIKRFEESIKYACEEISKNLH
jgi:glycerate kinase